MAETIPLTTYPSALAHVPPKPRPAPAWWHGYTTQGVAWEYDLFDWAWRIGFLLLGLVLGFLIGHFL